MNDMMWYVYDSIKCMIGPVDPVELGIPSP